MHVINFHAYSLQPHDLLGQAEAKVLRGFGDHVAAASASMKMLMWRKRSGDAAKAAQVACEQVWHSPFCVLGRER